MFSPPLLKFAKSSLGYAHSEITKGKMSLIKKSDPNLLEQIQFLRKLNLGKKHSEEFRNNLSLKMSGSNNPNFGKTHSEEAKLKMSLAKIGKPLTQEHIEKIRVGYAKNKDKIISAKRNFY